MREKRANGEETCGKEKTSHLSMLEQIPWGEGKLEGKRKERKERKEKKKKRVKKRRGVRSSSFSLDFTKIGSSVFIRARGKVQLRDESFAWVRESGVFAKL